MEGADDTLLNLRSHLRIRPSPLTSHNITFTTSHSTTMKTLRHNYEVCKALIAKGQPVSVQKPTNNTVSNTRYLCQRNPKATSSCMVHQNEHLRLNPLHPQR